MKRTGQWSRRLLASGLLATLLTAGSGCLSCLHPVPAPPPEMAGPCHALPPHVRRHVHIFLMNGLDPLDAANLSGVRHQVEALGFTQIYSGQLYHSGWFERHLLRIKDEDPDGRVVLIGHGSGVNALRNLAQKAAAAGVTIDVLIALDVAAEDAASAGTFPVYVLGALGREEMIAQVAHALGQCASRVTVVETPLPGPELGPTPRPTVPLAPQSFGPDWDSLKPTTQLP
jgi:hypothetical protein